jgi:hypothetical protein
MVSTSAGKAGKRQHLLEFLAWLPSKLRDVPGIDWADLPITVREYCVRAIDNTSPDASHLVLAGAAACGAISTTSLLQLVRNLHALLNVLRTVCAMEHIADLRREALWNEFAAHTQPTSTRSQQLSAYSATSGKHYPRYLAGLSSKDAAVMQRYHLPPLPVGFFRAEGRAYERTPRSQNRQRVIRETLLPLVPALSELVVLRKRAMEQVLDAFHHAQQQVELGASSLPLAFALPVHAPSFSQQEGSWELKQEERTLHFRLWNKRSWVLGHQNRYSQSLIRKVEKAQGTYAPGKEQYFVEFDGEARDLLWYGDLIEQHLLQWLPNTPRRDPKGTMRLQLARSFGFERGCHTSRSGLIYAHAQWFGEHTRHGEELLFGPEALYRGVLYAAALALLAMTDGFSIGESLQISAERWVETPEGRKLHLLPNRAGDNEQRRLFTISPEAAHLLEEIERGLMEAYGDIPVIPASRRLSKFHSLEPEQYLFQWRRGMITPQDTVVLLRFLLHGVALFAPPEEALHVSVEQIRQRKAFPQEEHAQELLRVFGFHQDILTPLSPASRESYCRDLFSYWRFAGTYEAVFHPLTLEGWKMHLQALDYKRNTINNKVAAIQRIFAAAATQGYIDDRLANALQSVEKVPSEKLDGTANQEETGPHIAFSSHYKKCGRLPCSVCQEGEKKGHGPYFYGYWREGGRAYHVYIGRVLNENMVTQAIEKKYGRFPGQRAREDEQWIVDQCRQEPSITARELKDRLASERGTIVSLPRLNRIRATLGLRRPDKSPPHVQSNRPASYKLEDADISWLVQQKQEHLGLSSYKLQVMLREQRGKELGAHQIIRILRKHGFSTRRHRSLQQ